MKSNSLSYKVIAVISFLILSTVQFFLIYNTYKLKNEHYYLTEKDSISNEYGIVITNEKLYPGGGAILEHYLNGDSIRNMELVYKQGTKAFDTFQQRLTNRLYRDLAQHNNMDSIIRAIIRRHHLDKRFRYALMLEQLSIAFKANDYVTLYKRPMHYALIDDSLQSARGIRIGGTLSDPNAQNLTNGITVSVPNDYSYKITFSLYADTPDRTISILKSMTSIFILSLLSIISVVFLFFVTFRNWQKQKKLADMKSDFVNSITHEFHTPLSAIIVANKSLQNSKIVENPNNIRPLTDIIQRQGDRLKQLFEQVWDITNMQHLQLNKQKQSLHRLLEDILLDYRLKITDKDIQLAFSKHASEDIANVDSFWFTTMLVNIFDNALKYNTNVHKEIHVSTYNTGHKLVLSIEDNGIGMTAETQKHIFDKFYRNSDVLNHTKGLGVGLYYVKMCADAHQWHIDIESKPEEGSKFIIIIPVN